MDLNPQQFRTAVQAAFTAVQAQYAAVFGSTVSVYEQIATVVPSSTAANIYPVLMKQQVMKEWIGPKTIDQIGISSFTVENKDWQTAIEVDRNVIEDDQLGLVSVQTKQVAMAGKVWPDKIVTKLLTSLFVTIGHDGQYVIDTDHLMADVDGNQVSASNKSTKSLSAVSAAAAAASFGAARAQMRQLRDLDGNSLGIEPDVLVVPPALADVATALMGNEKFGNGDSNIYRNAMKVVVLADLKTPTEWYLLDTKKPLGALIFQVRKTPVPVSQTDLNSDRVFMTRKFVFGVEARGAAAIGMWQCIFGSTGTTP